VVAGYRDCRSRRSDGRSRRHTSEFGDLAFMAVPCCIGFGRSR
jgi:hypothetical protein